MHMFMIVKEQGMHADTAETALYLEKRALSSHCHKVGVWNYTVIGLDQVIWRILSVLRLMNKNYTEEVLHALCCLLESWQ